MRTLWKLMPIKFRNLTHFVFHRINSSRILLRLFSFRHSLTVRTLRNQNRPINLRIGESRFFSGWLSTNYQVFARHYLDATKDYGNAFCKYIFADNVIEHLDRDKGHLLLQRAFTALQPGGVIRIATPDLGQIATKYVNRDFVALRDFQKDLSNHQLSIQDFPDLLRVTFTAFGHHKGFIYDRETLDALLEQVGFVRVKHHQPGESDRLELRDLESRTGSSDLWSQMAVEAEKPLN